MRLAELHIEGFRAFAAPQSFDLNASAVVVVGVNGSGKTSLLDAVLWALCGQLPRVEGSGGSVRSGFAPSGETRVALGLTDGSDRIDIVRSQLPDEKKSRLTVDIGEGLRRGAAAEVALLEAVWPAALESSESLPALTAALTRSVYLQQDLVRQFVESDSDRERFDVLSQLVGAGRVGELLVQLEQGKRAWTGATNQLLRELEPIQARLTRVRTQLETASDEAEGSAAPEDWLQWWRNARAGGIELRPPEFGESQAAAALESALRQTDVLIRQTERRIAILDELRGEADVTPKPDARMGEVLRLRRDSAQAEFLTAEERLAAARDRVENRAREIALEHDRDRQLAELARLALAHLGERCPVCTQTYNQAHTVAHLEELIARAQVEPATRPESADDLSALMDAAAGAQAVLTAADAAIAEHQHTIARAEAVEQRQRRRLNEIGVDETADAQQLDEIRGSALERRSLLADLRPSGERLALALASRAQIARRDELAREEALLARRVSASTAEIEERTRTGDLAQLLLEAVREAAADVVGLQLKDLEPLLAQLYARVDPHPVLRDIAMRSWTERGRGRLRTLVSDPTGDFQTDVPSTILSSSQLNGLAVATFLALNLGVPAIPLDSAMLDDPLQSLDDVNLLGVVDLLRRIKERRQLIVTTHDPRFGDLLARKFRAHGTDRTVRIDMSGWGRDGPYVAQRDVPSEPRALHLVA